MYNKAEKQLNMDSGKAPTLKFSRLELHHVAQIRHVFACYLA